MDAAWICPEEFLREPIDIFGKELERKNAAYAHPDNLVNYHMLVRKCFQMDAADEPLFLEITADDYYKVYVDAPEGAEVYLDGNYMGIAPCSFRKVAGAHVITLRRTGFDTRSYTVQIDDEEKDITYSFANLVLSSTTVSGNSSSQ